MGEGVALALAAGALVLVFVITRQQEAKAAAMAASIIQKKQSAGLGAGDVFGIAATTVATVYGGPGAGVAVAHATGVTV